MSTLDLVRLVAAKLDGHGAHCAALINPPRGSLSPECVWTRCTALLSALCPAEGRIVVALLAAGVEAAGVGGVR